MKRVSAQTAYQAAEPEPIPTTNQRNFAMQENQPEEATRQPLRIGAG